MVHPTVKTVKKNVGLKKAPQERRKPVMQKRRRID